MDDSVPKLSLFYSSLGSQPTGIFNYCSIFKNPLDISFLEKLIGFDSE